MCIPNFISGIFGVTEPAIYGVLLPLKKPFIVSGIAGGIGGAFLLEPLILENSAWAVWGFLNFQLWFHQMDR